MDYSEADARLLLCWCEVFTHAMLTTLLERHGSYCTILERLLASHDESFLTCGLRKDTLSYARQVVRKQSPDACHVLLEKNTIRVVYVDDQEYPPLLRTVFDPPPILYLRGATLNHALPHIATVGTRAMSQEGARCVDTIIPDIAKRGVVTVSGMAQGVDSRCHAKTIEHGGSTVAVLGSGADDQFIRGKPYVGKDILEHGGTIISERPPLAQANKHAFPKRNRVIAGMSQATIVFEASQKSGSLITAKCALDAGREVLAVPGPIWNEGFAGTYELLRAGARLCTNIDDVLLALRLDRVEAMHSAQKQLPLGLENDVILANLSEKRHIDELAELVKLPSFEVSSKLSLLEIDGYVRHLGGQYWIRT